MVGVYAQTAEQLVQINKIRENLNGFKFKMPHVKPPGFDHAFKRSVEQSQNHKRDFISPLTDNNDKLDTTNCDYIVLGSGSAGSTVAGLLSNVKKNKVCLFEKGQDESVRDPYVQVPGLNWVQAVIPDGSLGPIEAVPTFEPKLGNFFDYLFLPWALAGGPGVSGSIWSCFSNRTFDDLAAIMGDSSLAASVALPIFRRNENVLPTDTPQLRGNTGPIQIQFLDENDPNLAPAVALQSAEFGFPLARDFCNPNGPAGIYPMQRSIKREPQCQKTTGPCKRESAYSGFVEPYINNRTNLRVYTQARVTRLLFDKPSPNQNRSVDGIAFNYRGKGYEIKAKKAVISSLGDYNDAKLLMLSGVGNATILEQNGIPVVKDLPGVGQKIQNVANIPLIWYLPILPNVTFPQGLQAPSTAFTSFFASGYHGTKIDIELLWGLLPAFLVPALGPDAPGAILLLFVIQLIDIGDGFMTPRTTEHGERFNYQANFDPDKMNATIWAIQKVRNSFSNLGASYPASFEIIPGADLALNASFEDIRAYIKANDKNTQFNFNHPFSSCYMGPPTDPLAVVDSKQRVYGFENLFIASNAIANPETIPDGHPSSYATYWGRVLAENIINGVV